MKASAITRRLEFGEDNEQTYKESISPCNFDQGEIFSWTVINDDNGIPDFITLITKRGISMEIEYDENILSSLAAEFRSRGVL